MNIRSKFEQRGEKTYTLKVMTLMKDFEEETNKWKGILMFMNWKN